VAAIDEIYQSFVPGRLMSASDWCADALGLAIGMSVFLFVGKNRSTLPAGGANELRGREEKRANRA
jgi:VanZ family protein